MYGCVVSKNINHGTSRGGYMQKTKYYPGIQSLDLVRRQRWIGSEGPCQYFKRGKTHREGGLNNNLLLLQVGSQQDRMHRESIFRFPNITLPLLALSSSFLLEMQEWQRRRAVR